MKSKGTAYLLWAGCVFFLCGLHRLYLGKIGTGLLWLFTAGLLGVGQIYDLFTLGNQVEIHNLKHASKGGGETNISVNINNPGGQPEAKVEEE